MRAANVAVIDAHAAVNDAFIDAAAANNSFADESAALDAYAAALHKALEAYRIGLETVLDSYAAAMAELIGIAANDQFDFVVTGTPALAAMNIARAVASETHNTAREVGYKEIQDAVYSATGERERLAALDAFAEDSAALLAANEGYSTAAEAFLVARDDLRNAFFDVVRERKPPRHGDEYAMAVLAATDPVDAGDVMEAAREAARQAYATSPKAAFDAALNVIQEHFSSGIAAVPTPTPTPRFRLDQWFRRER